MSEVRANSEIKEIQIEAVVIRANGTQEPLGTISYWHKNPVKRLLNKLRIKNGSSN